MPVHICEMVNRIERLEKECGTNTMNLTLLINRFDSLISILKVISVMMGGALVTVLGFLITYWVKG